MRVGPVGMFVWAPRGPDSPVQPKELLFHGLDAIEWNRGLMIALATKHILLQRDQSGHNGTDLGFS